MAREDDDVRWWVQALVTSNEELKRANGQLIEELSSRSLAAQSQLHPYPAGATSGMGGSMAGAQDRTGGGGGGQVAAPFGGGGGGGQGLTWPTLDGYGRVAVTVSFDGGHTAAYMDAEQRLSFSEALRLDVAYALEAKSDRVQVTNLSPSGADVVLSNYAAGSQDLRTSTDLGKLLIAQVGYSGTF